MRCVRDPPLFTAVATQLARKLARASRKVCTKYFLAGIEATISGMDWFLCALLITENNA